MVARRVKRLSILEDMKKSILGLMALCLWSCGDSDSFSTCQETTVAGLRELSSQVQNSSFCRTIYGEVSFQYSGRCARKGCFFLYDVDAQGNRVKGDSIYLSDASAFPSKWQDASAVHLTRVTGDYYPSKDYSCDDFSNLECQRAFYVKDVE